MFTRFAVSGALHALLAVALGAFAAHGLKDRLDSGLLSAFETGVRYHMYHALGLILVGLLAERIGHSRGIVWGGRLLHAGIILFSGSLYALSVSGVTALGIVTPFGGLAFLAGWAMTAAAVWRSKRSQR